MDILSMTYPFSYITLGIGILIGGILTSFFFGSIAFISIFILAWLHILNIDPILQLFHSWFVWYFPGKLEAIQERIRSTFTIDLSPDVLKLAPESPCMFLWHPHGLFPLSHYFHTVTDSTAFPKHLKPIQSVCIYWIQWIPFASQIMKSLKIVPSNYKDMKECLQRGERLSVSLGGVREIFLLEPTKLRLTIQEKKGVFRLALEEGAALIPCISYGENEYYEGFKNPYVEKIQKMIYSTTGFILPIPTKAAVKRWWGLVAGEDEKGGHVHTVTGAPLFVSKVNPNEICDKMIIDLRDRYIRELRALYKKTRPSNYADDILIEA